MKLYQVINGYWGDSYVRCLVIADSKERAIEIARPKFKEDDERESYYNNLEAILIASGCDKEFVGEIED